MSKAIYASQTQDAGQLSVAVVGPDRRRRIAAAAAFAQIGQVQTREFLDYPSSLEEATQTFAGNFDVVAIDLDSNPSFALDLVEILCVTQATIVMVFSSDGSTDSIMRSMRAGAREFFTIPFSPQQVEKAMQWVSAHRGQSRRTESVNGRTLIVFGSKGGVGATTLASNLAVALAEQSGKRTLLIDLNLQMGDAAANIGITAPYSVLDALKQSTRLNAQMLSSLLATHKSGLSILAAPAEFHSATASPVAVGCLVAVARQQFDFVVLDAGKKVDLRQMHLFEPTATAFLVTQIGIPELRNANRLIAQFSAEDSPKLEIVINRYQSRFLGLTDAHLAKALTRPIQWRIPNDFAAVQKMQNTGIAMVSEDKPISRVIRQMASSVCGASDTPAVEEKRRVNERRTALPAAPASEGEVRPSCGVGTAYGDSSLRSFDPAVR